MKTKSLRVMFRAAWMVLAFGLSSTLPQAWGQVRLTRDRLPAFEPKMVQPYPSENFEQMQPIVELPENEIIRIKLAWLRDRMTFPYQLQLQATQNGVRVTGYVPNDAIRKRVMQIAQEASGMPIQDGMAVMSSMTPRIPQPSSLEKMRQQGWQVLAQAAPTTWRNLRLGVDEQGQFAISGSVASAAESLRLCQALQKVPGCRCVISQLRVAGGAVTLVPGGNTETSLRPKKRLIQRSHSTPLPRWKTPTQMLHTTKKTTTKELRNPVSRYPQQVRGLKTTPIRNVASPRSNHKPTHASRTDGTQRIWQKPQLNEIAKASQPAPKPKDQPTPRPAKIATNDRMGKTTVFELPRAETTPAPKTDKIFQLVTNVEPTNEAAKPKFTVIAQTTKAQTSGKSLEDVVPDLDVGKEWDVNVKGTKKGAAKGSKKAGGPTVIAKDAVAVKGLGKLLQAAKASQGAVLNLRPRKLTVRGDNDVVDSKGDDEALKQVKWSPLPAGRQRLVPEATTIAQAQDVPAQQGTRIVPIPKELAKQLPTQIATPHQHSGDRNPPEKKWTRVMGGTSFKPTSTQTNRQPPQTLPVPDRVVDLVMQTCGTDVTNLQLRVSAPPAGQRHKILHIGFSAPTEAIARSVGTRLGQVQELRTYRMKFRVDLTQ